MIRRLNAAHLLPALVLLALALGAHAEGAAPPAPAAPAPPAGAPPPPRRPQIDAEAPAETQFKNIQVLKGIKAGELRDSMEFIEAALGMGCGACHVRGGMDKDDKPAKETARKMMRMVAGLNRDMFEGKNVITCNTCHQGRPKPLSVPAFERPAPAADAFVKDMPPPGPPPAPGQPPSPPAAAPALPAADAVLDRFVAALGGRTALDGLKGLSLHATQQGEEQVLSIDMKWQPPSSMVSVVHGGGEDHPFVFTQGSDGRKTWGRMNEDPAQDMHGLRHVTTLRESELLPAFAFSAGKPAMEVLATGKIGATAVVVLALAGADGVTDRFYFDSASGLLVRRAFEVPTPLGPLPHETDYSDWRPEGGVKIPHVLRAKQPGEGGTMTIDQVQVTGALDAATFAKPAPPPAP